MPEGPSIVILVDKIKALHLGKPKILGVSGSAKGIDEDQLVGQDIQAFKSHGKHFLICLKDLTITIHLMLFGTYLINETKKKPLKFGIRLKNDELNFYTCNVNFLEGNVKQHFDWRNDIMDEEWDDDLAVERIMAEPKALICDVLLDQKIFAGVGNIIKNESLYLARINPLTEVKDLTKSRLKQLIKETRKYSFNFLKWKKEDSLSKHWKVYRQKVCENGHKIIKKELGKTHRQTYFCEACQAK